MARNIPLVLLTLSAYYSTAYMVDKIELTTTFSPEDSPFSAIMSQLLSKLLRNFLAWTLMGSSTLLDIHYITSVTCIRFFYCLWDSSCCRICVVLNHRLHWCDPLINWLLQLPQYTHLTYAAIIYPTFYYDIFTERYRQLLSASVNLTPKQRHWMLAVVYKYTCNSKKR